jgi:hypothetical protein
MYFGFIFFRIHSGLFARHMPCVLEHFCSFVFEGCQNLWLCSFYYYEMISVMNLVLFVCLFVCLFV